VAVPAADAGVETAQATADVPEAAVLHTGVGAPRFPLFFSGHSRMERGKLGC
jgi:hypothetical protein